MRRYVIALVVLNALVAARPVASCSCGGSRIIPVDAIRAAGAAPSPVVAAAGARDLSDPAVYRVVPAPAVRDVLEVY